METSQVNSAGKKLDGVCGIIYTSGNLKGILTIAHFQNNSFNGYAYVIFNDGSAYIGQLKDGLKHGQGNFYWTDGDVFTGIYANDIRTQKDFWNPGF